MNWHQLREARRVGERAAQRRLEALGIALDSPVDVFKIIQDDNIWLMFQPLNGVYGTYQREDGASGVLLNARHPLPLQRFTAAHEYGHHVLGHQGSLDGETEIEDEADNFDEVAAHTFAAEFLMPLGLVNSTLRTLGLEIKPSILTPLDVYRMSVLMETSYAATVFHLVNLKKIDLARAKGLRGVTPKEIKQAEAGRPLEQARADCWFLDSRQSGRLIRPRIGDEVHLSLPATPSTGYVWQMMDASQENGDSASLPLIHEEFREDIPNLLGGQGAHRLAFRVRKPIHRTLEVVHAQPWDRDRTIDNRFQVEIDAADGPIGDRVRGLTERQHSVLVGN